MHLITVYRQYRLIKINRIKKQNKNKKTSKSLDHCASRFYNWNIKILNAQIPLLKDLFYLIDLTLHWEKQQNYLYKTNWNFQVYCKKNQILNSIWVKFAI